VAAESADVVNGQLAQLSRLRDVEVIGEQPP